MSLTPQFGSIQPSQLQQPLQSNYLQFNGAGAGANNFAQQYLPEIYEQEVERYGNRTLSGFLKMVGAEMPMTSDQVIWSEQNRLHISYNNVVTGAAGGTANNLAIPVAAGIVNVISLNDTIVILDPATGNEAKALVTASNTATGALVVQPYSAATLVATFGAANAGLKIFVYGSDYGKGSQIATGTGVAGAQAANTRVSVNPSFTQYSNSPIILRSQYTISVSDM